MIKNMSAPPWFHVTSFMGLMMIVLAIIIPYTGQGLAPYYLTLGTFTAAFLWPVIMPSHYIKTIAPVLVFLAYAALSIFWTLDSVRGNALKTIFYLCWTIGLLLILAPSLNALLPTTKNQTSRYFCIGFCLALLAITIEILLGHPVYRFIRHLPAAEFVNPAVNNRAMASMAVLAFPFLYAVRQYHPSRILLIIALSVVAAVLSLSDSQSAQMGLFPGILALAAALFWPRFSLRAVQAMVIIAFVFAIPIAQSLHQHEFHKSEYIPKSFRHRIEIWYFTATRALEAPIWGHGLDSAREIESRGEERIFSQDKNLAPLHPHNFILQILYELGIIGGAIAAFLWVWLAQQTKRLHATLQPYALGSMVSFFCAALFGFGIWQIWWLCTALLAGFLIILFNHPTTQNT